VLIKPNDIGAIPEIFQPREFTFGLRDHDRIHVKALQQEIRIHGELHPPLVIKLKPDGWIVVEGHHRLAAYKAEGKGDQSIKCRWFRGSVREAADAALSRNNIIKLNIKQPDRVEEAWKRVINGWGSKAQIVRLCSVGDGTVATMRRAVRLAQIQDPADDNFQEAVAFRKRLSEYGDGLKENATPAEAIDHLKTLTWGIAGVLYRGVTKAEFDANAAALRLARHIQERLKDTLVKDPKTTARALNLIDPMLPWQLVETWREDGIPFEELREVSEEEIRKLGDAF
jgi:hypothetical protein